jgi:hypothetical protein
VIDSAALLRSNRRRRVVRRALTIGAIPVLLIALAVVAKVLSMYSFAYHSAAAYSAEDFAGTTQAARGQEPFNVFEPYKAPFNVGVGLTSSGDLAGGRAAFEQALALAKGLEQCAVRVNLAITIERTGDAALAEGDQAAAREAWSEALAVMQEAPEGCRSPEANELTPDPDQNLTDTMDEEERRLLEKLRENTTPPPPEQPEEPDDSEPLEEDEIEAIEDLLEQGIEERDEELGDEDGGGPWTDQPW